MQKAVAIVHCGPALGAGFAQYTAELQSGGRLGTTAGERFLYVLEGHLAIEQASLQPGSFAFIPEGDERTVDAAAESRVIVIEKRYQQLPESSTPPFFIGHEHQIEAQALAGDPAVVVRTLAPDDRRYDFAVNTMTYQPGASLSMVEIHIMEHGLLMLEGSGIYRLGDSWYPVTAGDFIWMAPYCPQWFGALGKTPAKYLIYKDWNRQPL